MESLVLFQESTDSFLHGISYLPESCRTVKVEVPSPRIAADSKLFPILPDPFGYISVVDGERVLHFLN